MPIDQYTVREQCERFAEMTGTTVAPLTQELIVSTLVAIVDEPHPAWSNVDRYIREAVAEGFQANLFTHLLSVREAEEAAATRGHYEFTNELTYFGVMHWLTVHLSLLCPWE